MSSHDVPTTPNLRLTIKIVPVKSANVQGWFYVIVLIADIFNPRLAESLIRKTSATRYTYVYLLVNRSSFLVLSVSSERK